VRHRVLSTYGRIASAAIRALELSAGVSETRAMQPGAARSLVEARGLRKAFGLSPVLRDVDLDVFPGEVVAILGPNGAGKSTLLRILGCISRASRGQLALFGTDCHPGRATREVLGRIGFLGHEAMVYEDLTPQQNLEVFARLYRGVRGGDGTPEAIARASLERVGLAYARERVTRALSRGMLQRLAIARATQHEPPLLLLDEPFTALDEAGVELLSAIVRQRAIDGAGIVLITHDLARVAELATRVVVLVGGRVAYDASPVPRSGDLAHDYRRLTGLAV
jgi:ABC-type multidrug transport system ATPase subunit